MAATQPWSFPPRSFFAFHCCFFTQLHSARCLRKGRWSSVLFSTGMRIVSDSVVLCGLISYFRRLCGVHF